MYVCAAKYYCKPKTFKKLKIKVSSGQSVSGVRQSGVSVSGVRQSGVSVSGVRQSGVSVSGVRQSGVSVSLSGVSVSLGCQTVCQWCQTVMGVRQSGVSVSLGCQTVCGVSQSGVSVGVSDRGVQGSVWVVWGSVVGVSGVSDSLGVSSVVEVSVTFSLGCQSVWGVSRSVR